MSRRLTAQEQWLRTKPESGFQDDVVEMAELLGWTCWHDNDSRRNRAGLPDLIMVRPPRFLCIELKTEQGRVRPEQRVWGELLGQCPGIEYYLLRPRDTDRVMEILR